MSTPAAAATARWTERQKREDPEGFAERRRVARRKWRESNYEKYLAHKAVRRAIENGTLTRPDRCERCQKECRPEASHDDYEKRFEVEWLCRPCHARKDARPRKQVD